MSFFPPHIYSQILSIFYFSSSFFLAPSVCKIYYFRRKPLHFHRPISQSHSKHRAEDPSKSTWIEHCAEIDDFIKLIESKNGGARIEWQTRFEQLIHKMKDDQRHRCLISQFIVWIWWIAYGWNGPDVRNLFY